MTTKKINILLADDDLDDCNFFRDALNELPGSSDLTTVHDGDQLMKLLLKESTVIPDVLFLDINMPRKNGFECLKEIRKNEKLKALPVVMFSTSNSWDKINQLFESGAHVYIHKPGDFAQLKQVILHALSVATENNYSNGKLKYILNA